CLLKSARAFMVFQALEREGEIVKSNPPVTAIEDEQFDNSFELIVVSQRNREEIAQVLDTISELEQVDVVAYTVEAPQEARQDKANEPEEQSRGGGGSEIAKKLKTGRTVRVDINRLDGLMNLMSELVINKTRINELAHEIAQVELNEATNQLNRISGELQNLIMQVRMVPIEQVFNRFPRMVRDLARELNKEITLVIEGEETELDRTVIDEIGEPILHLVRNAVDHGIEGTDVRVQRGKPAAGTVRLSAFPHGHTVVIEVEDDGKGIDPDAVARKAIERGFVSERELSFMDQQERLMLIFQPGFSTADKVSDVSGRGVGLDVVKTQVESLGGTVELVTSPGQGSKFVISLPLTLAILQSLLVQSGTERYAIPLSSIDQTFSLQDAGVKTVRGQEVTMYRGHVLPLIRLQRLLDVPDTAIANEGRENYVVVLKRNDKMLGLVVDELVGHQEIVIKTLGKYLGNVKGIAGATILGNGQIALILDVPSLF
ncbi:MAG: chemotaxis protein CheW, partial [Bacillota bacterium]